jgi:adenosylcobinamide-GDP ribazoletransferase
MKRQVQLLLVATQFLTRVPVPWARHLPADGLADASHYLPVVGAIVGAGAVAIDKALVPYAERSVIVVIILFYFVLITGGLHEDALADTADGCGGGWTKEQVLTIMRDSRIGSFGVLAIALGLLARFVFLTSLPAQSLSGALVAGQVLSRWTALPLARWLPPARDHLGQGARMAQRISVFSLSVGTALAVGIVFVMAGTIAFWTIGVAAAVTGVSGAYYRRRIDGITGDCLGATNQLTEIAVYLVGTFSHA